MSQRLYEKERDKVIEEGLKNQNEEYEKKLQKLTQNLNIERSAKINEVRLRKMRERNQCIEKVKEETRNFLLRKIVNPENVKYREAVKNLII